MVTYCREEREPVICFSWVLSLVFTVCTILIFVNSGVKLSASSLQLYYAIKPKLPFSICNVFLFPKAISFIFILQLIVPRRLFRCSFSYGCQSYVVALYCFCAAFTFSFFWWLALLTVLRRWTWC